MVRPSCVVFAGPNPTYPASVSQIRRCKVSFRKDQVSARTPSIWSLRAYDGEDGEGISSSGPGML
jgi:hypothetical protein